MKKNDTYKHYKNQKKYVIHDFCKTQVNDMWVDAIIYFEKSNPNMLFCRTKEEFIKKFSKTKN